MSALSPASRPDRNPEVATDVETLGPSSDNRQKALIAPTVPSPALGELASQCSAQRSRAVPSDPLGIAVDPESREAAWASPAGVSSAHCCGGQRQGQTWLGADLRTNCGSNRGDRLSGEHDPHPSPSQTASAGTAAPARGKGLALPPLSPRTKSSRAAQTKEWPRGFAPLYLYSLGGEVTPSWWETKLMKLSGEPDANLRCRQQSLRDLAGCRPHV